MNSILSILIILDFWINYVYFCNSLSTNVVVTVNLDKLLPEKSELNIYDGSIDPACCKNFKKDGNGTVLILNTNLTYQKCNCTTAMFTILPYFTNISSAIITVKNEGPDIIKLINSGNNIILSLTNVLVSFIICKEPNCTYEGVDHNEVIKNFPQLKLHSTCLNIKPCLTYIEFGSELLQNEYSNTTYYSSMISLKASSLERKPKTILNCRNGGKFNGKKCICPRNDDFIERGPECESLQIRLTQKQFLYVLPNTKNIVIEFSIYATSFQGSVDILTIMKDGEIVMNYQMSETNHTLQVIKDSKSVPVKIDRPSRWIYIFINITNSEITAWIDGQNITLKQHSAEFYFALDGIPLILNKNNDVKKEICIWNLKVNHQIVDLYLPSYQNCQPKCSQCNENQTCIYTPFKSIGNANCFCKIGMRSSANSQCQLNNIGTVSLENKKVTETKSITDTETQMIQFIFRTFSPNGTLVSLNFVSPANFKSSIKIINSELYTTITNSMSDNSNTLPFYNVSDGEWHQINYKMTNNFIEVTLDEDLPFNSVLIKFDQSFFGVPNIKFKFMNATFGTLENSNWNKYSLTTCFNGFALIPPPTSTNEIQYPELNSSSTTNGCDGNFCQNITCSNNNSKCENKWGNPSCVCVANFTDVNGKCEFAKCNPNPCKNDGKCTIGENNNYKCVCSERFQGENCEIDIYVASFPWWIILLILLILLLIIIILLIYFCCCKKRTQPQRGPDINKLHENTVFYNESAGETDYIGPPINFDLMKFPQKVTKTPPYPKDELKERKLAFDTNNKDLLIDHPLDYGFEGVNSDAGSISSLGSGSTDNELNIKPIEETNDKFKYLKNLYK